jgi:hypothetical protein
MIFLPTDRDFSLILDCRTVLQLKNCGRIFSSICFFRVDFYEENFNAVTNYFSRFALFEFGIHKLKFINCKISNNHLRLLLSYIQTSVEILSINCSFDIQEEEKIESLPDLEFKKLKKLTIGFTKNEGGEEFFTSIFQRAPVLENLRIYSEGLGVVKGKSKLKKLALLDIECK